MYDDVCVWRVGCEDARMVMVSLLLCIRRDVGFEPYDGFFGDGEGDGDGW